MVLLILAWLKFIDCGPPVVFKERPTMGDVMTRQHCTVQAENLHLLQRRPLRLNLSSPTQCVASTKRGVGLGVGTSTLSLHFCIMLINQNLIPYPM